MGFIKKKHQETESVEEAKQEEVVVEEPVVEAESENQKEEIIIENKKTNNNEKNFFKSAFTTYLPVSLAVIALCLHFVYGSMLLVDALNVAQLFNVLANGTSIAGVIVEAVRQIKNKHFEFNPSLIIVLLTLFIVK